MSDASEGSPKLLRPRDASTLIIVRKGKNGGEVLMGERSAAHVFVPENFVFPGGRVDRSDAFVQPATPLRPEVLERLQKTATPRRALALAMAAVRETFEETGLIVGGRTEAAAKPGRAPKGWQHFLSTGMAPALGGLTYVARAVTPTGRPRRFNARFFVVDADAITGEETDSSELLKVRWFTLPEARKLKIRPITELVLAEIEARLAEDSLHAPERPAPAFTVRQGRRNVVYE
ncbi:8-oxo-dGTP pyrophosphatase MutT (NUDIX family) [Constrictibacter sp. MBR-5]|jgi:8-oxo-dGTP pyrophosphatase MutT (NUDIX family)|uniref:NUDIX hydrolase n=1 Tax=Constrictibacter sp. MBR-5 TaxID=3156467 RepID=UPI0033980E62